MLDYEQLLAVAELAQLAGIKALRHVVWRLMVAPTVADELAALLSPRHLSRAVM